MKEIIDLLKSEIEYFKKLKVAIGDLHGHIHSLSVKVAKLHLSKLYPDVSEWKTSEKYGSGIDVIGKDSDRIIVAAEVKTTARSEKESLGSQQRKKIKEDIDKLDSTDAQHKYLYVIDNKNKKAIAGILRNSGVKNIKLVNLFD